SSPSASCIPPGLATRKLLAARNHRRLPMLHRWRGGKVSDAISRPADVGPGAAGASVRAARPDTLDARHAADREPGAERPAPLAALRGLARDGVLRLRPPGDDALWRRPRRRIASPRLRWHARVRGHRTFGHAGLLRGGDRPHRNPAPRRPTQP